MKHTKTIVLHVALIGVVALLVLQYSKAKPVNSFQEYTSRQVRIGNTQYTLYKADTLGKKAQGLSDIPSMKVHEGMIFEFDTYEFHTFWMKDMHFSLDFIFVKDTTVVDIKSNIVPESYPESIVSKSKANKVIELNAGQVSESGVGEGDIIEYLE